MGNYDGRAQYRYVTDPQTGQLAMDYRSALGNMYKIIPNELLGDSKNSYEQLQNQDQNRFNSYSLYLETLNDLDAGNYSPKTKELINTYGGDIEKLRSDFQRQLKPGQKGDVIPQLGQSFEDWQQTKRENIGQPAGTINNPQLTYDVYGDRWFYNDQGAGTPPPIPEYNREFDYYGRADEVLESQKGKTFGKFMKVAAPIAALGLGAVALPALLGGAATGATALSPAVTSLASQGALLPASAITGTVGAGIGGASLSNLLTKQALGGAVKGGVGSFASGGDLSDVLKGATLGGLTGAYGGNIANSLGLSGAGADAFTGGLTRASGHIASGDTKSALLSGLAGAGSAYLQAGGEVPGLGSLNTSGMESSVGDLAGKGGLFPQSTFEGATGSGILGKIPTSTGILSGGGAGSMYGNLSNVLKSAGNIYSGMKTEGALEEQQKALQKSLAQAQQYYQPYNEAGTQANQQLSQLLSQGFSPKDLYEDPGYQFQLQQGEKALGNRLSASGMRQSGSALKAAQEYGQGLAAQSYDDAYARWLQNNQQLQGLASQGLGAASGLGNIATTSGAVNSQLIGAMQDNRNRVLADILSGAGSLFGGYYG